MDFLSPIGSSSAWVSLPAVVKLLLFLGGWGLLWLPLALGVAKVTGQPLRVPAAPEQKIPLLISLYALAPGLLWLYAHKLAGTTLEAYGWVHGPALAAGVLVGFVMGVVGVMVLSAIQLAAGWSQLELAKVDWLAQLGIGLALLGLTLGISAVEELIFRGWVVNQLQADYAIAGVVVVACAMFALLHLVWDGAAGIPQLPGLALMGAVLLLARWVDGGLLGLPCGLHWGWIWSLALIDTTGILVRSSEAPVLAVGRPAQPLTSPLVLGLLGATGLLLWWAKDLI